MPRLPSAAFIALLCLPLFTARCPAQAFVEHVVPPAAERGKTTRVTFVGAHLDDPLDLWTSLPSGAVLATPVPAAGNEAKAVFDLKVSGDAPVGVCGVRVATAGGLGNVHLFLIDDLPVRPAPVYEKAPWKTALPAAVWGTLREAEVERFAIDVAAGQRVSFEAVANRLGKDADPLVAIRDARGRLLAEHDNDPGLYVDCRFEHVFKEAGTYTVEVRDSRYHGSEHWQYVLRMGRFPAARTTVPAVVRPGKPAELRLPELDSSITLNPPAGLAAGPFFAAMRRPGDEGSAWVPLRAGDAEVTAEQEPNDTLAQATPAKVPGVLCGVLGQRGDRDFFRLDLKAGQKVRVRAEARAINSPADLEVVLTDAKGQELRRAGEGPQEEVVNLDFTAPAAGAFGLMVRDLGRDGGPAFTYRLEVTAGPHVAATAEVEGLTVPRGSYQPIPLTVVRTDYAGPVTLTLAVAPPGLSLTPAEVPAGVDAVVCKLSADAACPLGIHPLQLLAEAPGVPRMPVRTRPLIDRARVNVDLIPYALREDQRRLPPALTDRLALQVTPPATFTVELPEKQVILARYQHADFPVLTTRAAGFDGPISFSARGGPLGDKEELRSRVYAEFPQATTDRPKVAGRLQSRILAPTGKSRIEVQAVGFVGSRRVALARTFDLEVRTAFTISADPASVVLAPGGTARVRLLANRVSTFDGEVKVDLSALPGVAAPASVVIPRGRPWAEVEVKAAPDAMPLKNALQLSATAVVDGYEEEQRGSRIDVEVRKPVPPKK